MGGIKRALSTANGTCKYPEGKPAFPAEGGHLSGEGRANQMAPGDPGLTKLSTVQCDLWLERCLLQVLSEICDCAVEVLIPCVLFSALTQKSPAKKLSHAISKSLGCMPTREPSHPVFPEQPEKPLDLAHIV